MNAFSNFSTAEAILNIALHLTVVLFLGWLFMQMVRKRGAPIRSCVSITALLIILFIPFLSIGLIDWGLPHFSTPLHVFSDSGAPVSFAPLEGIEAVPEEHIDPNASGTKSQRDYPLVTLFGTGPAVVSLTNLFGLIWGLGSLFLLLRLSYGAYTLRRFTREKKLVSHKEIQSLLDEAAARFGRTIRTRIYESPHIGGPAVVGLFRPKILLPQDLLKRLRDGELRSILFHELSHIRHRDHISAIIQRIATALTWWNPVSHALSSAFSRAREEVSDNHVLLENNSHDYAECLINLAERTSRLRRLPVGFAMASPHIPLTDRVNNILSKERTMETQLKKSSLVMIVLLAILLVGGLTGYRLTFAAPAPEVTPGQEAHIKHPKLIKKVDPIYPKEAKQRELVGTVAVEAVIGTDGKIAGTKVIHSAHDILDTASLAAFRQWQYEPMELEGTSVRTVVTVIFQFRLEQDGWKVYTSSMEIGTEEQIRTQQEKIEMLTAQLAEMRRQTETYLRQPETDERPPLLARGEIKPPRLIKKVKHVYPEIARQAKVEGVVILEATTDIYGRVARVKVLRSIPLLDQAAVDAVRQWVYEPKIVGGEPRAITFTVTVQFKEDKERDSAGVSGGVTGGVAGGVEGGVGAGVGGAVKDAKLIKKVDPVYPQEAKDAGIEGVVIVELKTDTYGRVKDVKVLRSIPELDQAAIDAVKQWVYEPPLIDGKPQELVITVTVSFKKDEETDVIK